MTKVATVGFDLAKTVFQVHGADGEGRPVLRRKMRRGKMLAFFTGLPTCLVCMEACASFIEKTVLLTNRRTEHGHRS